MLESFSLKGRAAIVTGATGYLGTAMSHGLAGAGCRVLVTGRDENQAKQLAAKLPGNGHLGLAMNLENLSDIDRIVCTAEKDMGRIDVLVNNAYRDPPESYSTAEAFATAFQVGVTGYYLLSEKVMQHLTKRGSPGSIINTGSTYGVGSNYPRDYDGLGISSPAYYHALKGGVINMTRAMAVQWAKLRIRVNAVSPGCFLNARLLKEMPEFCGRLINEIPMGRLGKQEEIEGIVVFLASDASSYVTGQNFFVDGGWTAW